MDSAAIAELDSPRVDAPAPVEEGAEERPAPSRERVELEDYWPTRTSPSRSDPRLQPRGRRSSAALTAGGATWWGMWPMPSSRVSRAPATWRAIASEWMLSETVVSAVPCTISTGIASEG